MDHFFEYPYGTKVWIFKDKEELEGNDYFEWVKEKLSEDAAAYSAMREIKRFVRKEQSRTVVVEELRVAGQEAERGSSDAIINALFSTVARLSREIDELREG